MAYSSCSLQQQQQEHATGSWYWDATWCYFYCIVTLSLLAKLYKKFELCLLARVYEIYLFIYNHTSRIQTL